MNPAQVSIDGVCSCTNQVWRGTTAEDLIDTKNVQSYFTSLPLFSPQRRRSNYLQMKWLPVASKRSSGKWKFHIQLDRITLVWLDIQLTVLLAFLIIMLHPYSVKSGCHVNRGVVLVSRIARRKPLDSFLHGQCFTGSNTFLPPATMQYPTPLGFVVD